MRPWRNLSDSGSWWSISNSTVAMNSASTTGRAPGGNFIVAFDVNTGKEAWRFNTIPRENEPGGNTWNGLPTEKRTGGSSWVPGSYDPALNLVYFGVAPTYDTGPLRVKSTQAGMSNDALYTDSTIAISPDTGKLVWHYQHAPGEALDLDVVYRRVTGHAPPNSADSRIPLSKVLAWSLATAAAVAIVNVAVDRWIMPDPPEAA